jgi:glycosyltransferase involved in cell wall biosynthesis
LDDFEVLLVAESQSADKSVEVCQNYADADRRVKLFCEDGTGFPAARNRGLDEAQGAYMTFVDADDYILPGMFSAMHAAAANQKLDILCCGGKKDAGGQRVGEMSDYVKFGDEFFAVDQQNQRDYMYKLAVSGRTITVWGKFYERGFLARNKLRFHPEVYADDFAFNFACYTAAERVGTISAAFYVYCDRRDSRLYSSSTADIERSADILWELYSGYAGAAPADVRAYAAVRIISSALFNLKLKPISIERICATVWAIIEKSGMQPHLLRAADEAKFSEYARATAMSGAAADNFLRFIRSLQSRDALLAWQKRYAAAEKEDRR